MWTSVSLVGFEKWRLVPSISASWTLGLAVRLSSVSVLDTGILVLVAFRRNWIGTDRGSGLVNIWPRVFRLNSWCEKMQLDLHLSGCAMVFRFVSVVWLLGAKFRLTWSAKLGVVVTAISFV